MLTSLISYKVYSVRIQLNNVNLTQTQRKNLHWLWNSDTKSLGGNAWQGETWKKFGSQERLLHSTFGIIQMRGHVMSQIDTALGHTQPKLNLVIWDSDFNVKVAWQFNLILWQWFYMMNPEMFSHSSIVILSNIQRIKLNLNIECHWQIHDYVYEKKACSRKLDSQGVNDTVSCRLYDSARIFGKG